MATNQRYTHFDHISLEVPEGTKSGDPVIVGQIAGVAQTDRGVDGRATVWLDGSYMLPVSGAVTEGQALYLDTPGGDLTTDGTKFFGVAVLATTGAGDAEVAPAGILAPAVPAAG